jgi:hypothetical protein
MRTRGVFQRLTSVEEVQASLRTFGGGVATLLDERSAPPGDGATPVSHQRVFDNLGSDLETARLGLVGAEDEHVRQQVRISNLQDESDGLVSELYDLDPPGDESRGCRGRGGSRGDGAASGRSARGRRVRRVAAPFGVGRVSRAGSFPCLTPTRMRRAGRPFRAARPLLPPHRSAIPQPPGEPRSQVGESRKVAATAASASRNPATASARDAAASRNPQRRREWCRWLPESASASASVAAALRNSPRRLQVLQRHCGSHHGACKCRSDLAESRNGVCKRRKSKPRDQARVSRRLGG